MTDRTRGGSPRAALWLAGVAGLGFAVSVLIWQFAAAPARLLAAEGVETTATLVAGQVEEGRGDDRRIVTVAFAGPDGQEMRVRGVVSQALYGSLAVGDTLPVRYARSNPQVMEAEPGAVAGPARVTGWIAVVMGAVFAALLAAALRRRGGAGA